MSSMATSFVGGGSEPQNMVKNTGLALIKNALCALTELRVPSPGSSLLWDGNVKVTSAQWFAFTILKRISVISELSFRSFSKLLGSDIVENLEKDG
jgi:hypothetical protein